MKMYKVRTRTANVIKETFPHLINKLCDCTFTTAHFKAALKSAGLTPLHPSAISNLIICSSQATVLVH